MSPTLFSFSFSCPGCLLLSFQPGALVHSPFFITFTFAVQGLFFIYQVAMVQLSFFFLGLVALAVEGAPILEPRIAQTISASTAKWEQACVRFPFYNPFAV